MKDFDPARSFGEAVAASYDDEPRGDETDAVAFLEQLAGDCPALELAVGTGRIALPLAARGVRVDGIDISPDMVARLLAKPGGQAISVTIGDFADVPVAGKYGLVYVVFNTLFNLLSQDAQVRCFENVAAHLSDEGSFVVEAFVPTFLHRLHNIVSNVEYERGDGHFWQEFGDIEIAHGLVKTGCIVGRRTLSLHYIESGRLFDCRGRNDL